MVVNTRECNGGNHYHLNNNGNMMGSSSDSIFDSDCERFWKFGVVRIGVTISCVGCVDITTILS